ncbi:5'-nucleotidase [Tetrabaena socialis]|uniref:5'-nucleotidase n=1 Tax=Tetrabaena socialis TaxID=47790 RepID=A0A2J8A015_9CHLO|nr:5'-nucleotidase [Tetrabaena socialis]|eukprot:PNH05871.1 5'-nucleotidase [Tetrabaena socialis]
MGCAASSANRVAPESAIHAKPTAGDDVAPAKKFAEDDVEMAQEPVSSEPQATLSTGDGGARKLTILHFNDVYNIEEQAREPVGGAARFCAKVKEVRKSGANPLVLFSGDAYNPSLMSTMTLGKQMVPILNEIGVNVSCIGNHEFDYGLDNLMKLNAQCNFPWLMANVLERGTDLPYAGAGTTWIEDWNGIKVGVVGLVEEEWLETLGAVNVSDMIYKDFVEVGREAAAYLKSKGAELLVALTHMREPNDRKLAAEVPEFHLILGGHDHHYVSAFVEPHNNLMVKSGTDFRDLSIIEVEFAAGSSTEPKLSVERIIIDSSVPEDPATKDIVNEYMKIMGDKMDEDIGETLEPLDGRFQTVRNRESNLGNFVADVWRKAAGAQITILNSGSLRSDSILPAGIIKARDFVAILPMVDTTMVLECTGAQVVIALENAVSQWPKLEGRFPQVSGLKFKFDPLQPPGNRIVPGSVYLTEFEMEPELLDMERKYKTAVKEYLGTGKDGFNIFTECKVLVDAEAGVILPSTIKCHFIQLRVLNKWDGKKIWIRSLTSRWIKNAKTRSNVNLVDMEKDAAQDENKSYHHSKSTMDTQERTHGLAVTHPDTGLYCIAPKLEGRIINIREVVEDDEEKEKKKEEEEEEEEPEMQDGNDDTSLLDDL